ncbi:hypothetical protein ACO0K0_01565 [Undibacterium sp. SXout11W]|uniref:hypothetical protein n=1 Tax=Undibacterium sp. SXout11W TaxID=3413050 RepID=UPI003BF1D149
MEKKEVIGHINCPTCGFEHMEIKPDKNGHAFGYCSDCSTQLFTRNDFRDKRLRANMRPVTVSVTVTEQTETPVTAKAPQIKDITKPDQQRGRIPVPDKKPEQPKQPETKTAGWFTPILGS